MRGKFAKNSSFNRYYDAMPTRNSCFEKNSMNKVQINDQYCTGASDVHTPDELKQTCMCIRYIMEALKSKLFGCFCNEC